jgi:hypothetical protein
MIEMTNLVRLWTGVERFEGLLRLSLCPTLLGPLAVDEF